MIDFKLFFEHLIVNEAISLKNVRKKGLRRKYSGAYTEILNKLFEGKDRLVYPITIDYSQLEKHELYKNINSFLYYHGYEIPSMKDYINGVGYKIKPSNAMIATDLDLKNPVKIGKLLQKFEPDGEISVTTRVNGRKTTKKVAGKPLLHEFKNDPLRLSNGEMLVVISRHPYDIAGMSTDRSWTSCMNLGFKSIEYNSNRDQGINRRYVRNDISEGTLIAYIVPKNELLSNGKVKLRRPLSRILMKPHPSDNGKLYTLGKMYGNPYENFKEFLEKWITENLNTNTGGKAYRNAALYNDTDQPIGFEFKSGRSIADRMMESALDLRNEKRLGNQITFSSRDDHQRIFYDLVIKFPFSKKLNIPAITELDQIRHRKDIQEIFNDFEKELVIQIMSDLELSRLSTNQYWELTVSNNDDYSTISTSLEFSIPYSGMDGKDMGMDEDYLEEVLQYGLEFLEDFDYNRTYSKILKLIKNYDFESQTNKLEEYHRKSLENIPKVLDIVHTNFPNIANLKPFTMQQVIAMDNYNQFSDNYDKLIRELKTVSNIISELKRNIKYSDRITHAINEAVYNWFLKTYNLDLDKFRKMMRQEWILPDLRNFITNSNITSDNADKLRDAWSLKTDLIYAIKNLIGDYDSDPNKI